MMRSPEKWMYHSWYSVRCAANCARRCSHVSVFCTLYRFWYIPRTTRCIKNDTRWARPGIYSFVPLRSLLSQWCIQGAAMVRPPPGLTVVYSGGCDGTNAPWSDSGVFRGLRWYDRPLVWQWCIQAAAMVRPPPGLTVVYSGGCDGTTAPWSDSEFFDNFCTFL